MNMITKTRSAALADECVAGPALDTSARRAPLNSIAVDTTRVSDAAMARPNAAANAGVDMQYTDGVTGGIPPRGAPR